MLSFCSAWAPSSDRLCSVSAVGQVAVWLVPDGDNLFTRQGHSSAGWCIDWSPDGKRLASGGIDGFVVVSEAATGDELLRLKYAGAVGSLIWSPDGKHLAAGGGSQGRIVIRTAADFVLPKPAK